MRTYGCSTRARSARASRRFRTSRPRTCTARSFRIPSVRLEVTLRIPAACVNSSSGTVTIDATARVLQTGCAPGNLPLVDIGARTLGRAGDGARRRPISTASRRRESDRRAAPGANRPARPLRRARSRRQPGRDPQVRGRRRPRRRSSPWSSRSAAASAGARYAPSTCALRRRRSSNFHSPCRDLQLSPTIYSGAIVKDGM